MTITPWHDATDFEIAQRHGLDMEQIIDKNDKLLPVAGEFAGIHIKKARPAIVEKLQSKGLLVKTEDNYKHNVQLCYKCNTIIEPIVIPQWYIAMTKSLPDGRPSLRDMAVSAINTGEVKILSDRFEKTFMHWMDNIRDWPISRQIWWGIPIPVKYCQGCFEIIVDTDDTITACPRCAGANLEKDPDTFDTWFSSGQWPYATLMAKGGSDLDTYFPTAVMETGWDILFFWVARMVMLSYYRTGKAPFENVFLHGLVRDKDRQKMSKSKGNVVDPLGVIDTYGTDALRFALVFSTAAGNDIPLAEEKIKGMKHFANKLWNIARFIMSNVEQSDYQFEPITEDDKYILDKLNATVRAVTEHLNGFRLHEAAQEAYQFTWHELADIYIEKSKAQMQDEKLSGNTKKILLHQLIITLKLLHPFMPFITEEIWQKLYQNKLVTHQYLIIENWPVG
jgi:valyl-tRNA synthetase